MSNSKTLAITGSNGYLGKNTIKIAIQNGWNIHAIVRRKEVITEVESLGANSYLIPQFDKEEYKEAFSDCTAIIHFANIVCGSKEAFKKVNIEGLKQIITAAKEAKVKRIIYPSGLGVDKYGKKEWAKNDYFWSKREAEKLLIDSAIDYRIFRPSYILGPGDELIPEIIEQIIDGKVLIAGYGNVPMQPIFIQDAISAFLHAAHGLGSERMIYNLVGPEKVTMSELVKLVIKTIRDLGLNIPEPAIEYIPYEIAPEKLEICKEMIDVMRCDIIENGLETAELLDFNLSPLTKAIKAVVKDKMVHENDKLSKKAIVLLSGGIDSATVLYWAIKHNYTVIALTMNYKWRPKKEIIATKTLTNLLEIPLVEVPTPYIQDAIDLRMDGFPVPSATYAPQGFIPLRNLVFYSIAAYYASIYGYQFIIGGHIREDLDNFNDTSRSFFEGLEQLVALSRHSNDKSKIEFIFPFSEKTKAEVIQIAQELNVPMDKTWSCYGDFEKPCGRCMPCINRKKAIDFLKQKNSLK
jgi:7-cyano-7-deazaguanine synthase